VILTGRDPAQARKRLAAEFPDAEYDAAAPGVSEQLREYFAGG